MKTFITALTIAAVVLPATALPSAAAKLGAGKQATLESAPTAKGEKSYFKSVSLECGANSCAGTFKGKAGRIITVTEMQCAASSDGQAQGGQVVIGEIPMELLPIASRSTDGTLEMAIVKTPTNFALEGTQTAGIAFFFYGTANFATCLLKGTSRPS